MRHKILYSAFALIILVSFSYLAFSQFSRVEIRPRSYNFGKVKIGESKSKSISLRSSDDAFRVIEFSFLFNSSPDFIVTSMPEGRDIPPNRPEYFDVMYRPTSAGVAQATLRITTQIAGITSIVISKSFMFKVFFSYHLSTLILLELVVCRSSIAFLWVIMSASESIFVKPISSK